MYLAVVGADQYLSTSALHMMSLRLVELLNSPSFTVIGNVLGVLSQLLAKDHQLRSHIVLVFYSAFCWRRGRRWRHERLRRCSEIYGDKAHFFEEDIFIYVFPFLFVT